MLSQAFRAAVNETELREILALDGLEGGVTDSAADKVRGHLDCSWGGPPAHKLERICAQYVARRVCAHTAQQYALCKVCHRSIAGAATTLQLQLHAHAG